MPTNQVSTALQKKRFPPLLVTMTVFDVAQDQEIRSRTFDFNSLELRKWFEGVQIWALMNGHAIELVKADSNG